MKIEKLIYLILNTIKDCMDYNEVIIETLTPEALNSTKEKIDNVVELLYKDGYIRNIDFKEYCTGAKTYDLKRAKITSEGIDYLNENATMRKVYNALRGIKELI